MPRKTTKNTKSPKKTTKANVKKQPRKPAKKPVVAVKQPVVAPPPPAPPAVPNVSEADKIWSEIRFRPIEMFALPNQIVEQHCTPFPADPSKLFLTTRSTAVLPSLEAACGKDFVVELADKFIIVTRPVAPPAPPKK